MPPLRFDRGTLLLEGSPLLPSGVEAWWSFLQKNRKLIARPWRSDRLNVGEDDIRESARRGAMADMGTVITTKDPAFIYSVGMSFILRNHRQIFNYSGLTPDRPSSPTWSIRRSI